MSTLFLMGTHHTFELALLQHRRQRIILPIEMLQFAPEAMKALKPGHFDLSGLDTSAYSTSRLSRVPAVAKPAVSRQA